MRPSAILGLLLLLSGCSGFGGFLGSTFSTTGDPNRPEETATVNLQRANGSPVVAPAPITPQPGDVWPGPIKPLPSLAEIAKTLPEAGTVPELPPVPVNPPAPIPPRSVLPGVTPPPATPPAVGTPPAVAAPSTSQYQPSVKLGTVVSTSRGPEKVSGGTGNFLTLTNSGGQYGGILVPNGNGTSTIIRPDGSVETVQTPR
ncbi:MAG: hypothetical protein ACREFO_17590 [Acetobacteraceae bacterium]